MTPMMQQFRAAKDAHPGMMVFFQNGEFYELFDEDAEVGHKLLGLTLTKREDHPMAGFPLAKLDHYLRLLLGAGQRVAVVEQLEPPNDGKKIIPRGVTRVVTQGTITEDELLDPQRPNHIVAVVRTKAGVCGLAWADLTAGLFRATDCTDAQLADELARLAAAECVIPDDGTVTMELAARASYPRPAWTFDPTTALDTLKAQFHVSTMSGFGFHDDQPCLRAAGGLLKYLQDTLKVPVAHFRQLARHRADDYLILDEVTRRSLELTRTLRDNLRDGSLLSVIDRTVTPMGARFLHDALLAPPNDRVRIEERLDAVGELLREHALRGDLRELLDATADLHRLTTRVATARANPKDLAAIARTLRLLPRLKAKLTGRTAALLNQLEGSLELVPDVRAALDAALIDDPPYSPKEGGVIRDGYSPELDELRRLSRDGKAWIAKFQADEITRTGIHSLKVGFTDVMGYYIEITNANETRVPENYMHERTLKNAKRYITPQLKEYEEKVLTAQEKSQALEFELFLKLRDECAARTERLLQTADVLAQTDFLAALAELAAARNYVRPVITDAPTLHIRDGRHPVLDQTLPAGTFVPNDTHLDTADGLFWLVTGPNMAGKSTFLRQTALVTLLAHVGSFVPASAATVGLTDRIFTRVGASDELTRGQSTFMVEMTEAANILNGATARSLVILDEIGRGTATYDGVSLAWAITEYLHDVTGCRALFATHYHELAQLETTLPNLRCYTVQVQEMDKEIIFLHKIAAGSAGKSYGIHVAKLAGVPEAVLRRAEVVLATLEAPKPVEKKAVPKRAPPPAELLDPPERAKRKAKPAVAGPNLFGEPGE